MFPIVGQRFSPSEFAHYVDAVAFGGSFHPQFIVLHNTSSPTLADRPNGFTEQHMENLREFYSSLGWSGGPHLFIDDNGIWVFNPLDARGTHSPSWNAISWGVEMLGEYSEEPFSTGRGALVRDNAIAALAVLSRKIGADASALRFHKEDPNTTHKDCPGTNVVKADVVARLAAALSSPTSAPSALVSGRTLLLHGQDIGPLSPGPAGDDGHNYIQARPFLSRFLGDQTVGTSLGVDADGSHLTWNGADIPAPVFQDGDGNAWVQLAAIATWLGLTLTTDAGTHTITISRNGG